MKTFNMSDGYKTLTVQKSQTNKKRGLSKLYLSEKLSSVDESFKEVDPMPLDDDTPLKDGHLNKKLKEIPLPTTSEVYSQCGMLDLKFQVEDPFQALPHIKFSLIFHKSDLVKDVEKKVAEWLTKNIKV